MERIHAAINQHLHNWWGDCIPVLLHLLSLGAQHNVLAWECHSSANLMGLKHSEVEIFNGETIEGLNKSSTIETGHSVDRICQAAGLLGSVVIGQERIG